MALSAAERDLLEALVDWAAADLNLSGRPGAQGVINRLPRLNESRLAEYFIAATARAAV